MMILHMPNYIIEGGGGGGGGALCSCSLALLCTLRQASLMVGIDFRFCSEKT